MKDPLLYKIGRPIIIFIFKIIYKPVIINNKVIPKNTRAVLAGNHLSKTDLFIVAASTKRCIRGVAKDELFKGLGKYIFENLGAIPVNRRIKDKSVIPACTKIINQDGIVGLMPEGTINRTKDIIMPFKFGAVKMAYITKSPIIPFAIIGKPSKKYNSFNKGVKIVFDKPYYVKTNNLEKETKILEDKVKKLLR